VTEYVPDRGDVVWLQFNPQAGHEQAGRRPALVISPIAYNRKVGLLICCPITNQEKGYPFEVKLPEGVGITGAILSDQVKSLDWKVRQATFIVRIPDDIMIEVIGKLGTLLR
jgi:mRNA interferase MazF